ncbi:hypothetical protein RTBOTA2_006031 [Rhodotorula toruloides]|nr:hypothetical protein RTBOTA2_006031 [Rhodotorula toruloides]
MPCECKGVCQLHHMPPRSLVTRPAAELLIPPPIPLIILLATTLILPPNHTSLVVLLIPIIKLIPLSSSPIRTTSTRPQPQPSEPLLTDTKLVQLQIVRRETVLASSVRFFGVVGFGIGKVGRGRGRESSVIVAERNISRSAFRGLLFLLASSSSSRSATLNCNLVPLGPGAGESRPSLLSSTPLQSPTP